MYKNRMLRKIFRPTRDEITEGWGLQKEGLYDLNNIMQVIKSTMRWAGHVACMGERTSTYRVLVGTHDVKRPLGNLRIHGRIILSISKK